MNKPPKFTAVEEYIAYYPKPVQDILQTMRQKFQAIAPEATEQISYQILCFKVKGKALIHYAAFAKHVSMYPVDERTAKKLASIKPYLKGRGTAQFSLNEPIPYEIMEEVVRLRLKELSNVD